VENVPIEEECVSRFQFAIDFIHFLENERDTLRVGDQLRTGFPVFEAAKFVGTAYDFQTAVFSSCPVEGDHDAHEFRIQELLVVVSVVLVILPASRVRLFLHVQMVEVPDAIVEQRFRASHDSRTSAIGTVDVVGQPAPVDQPCVDSLVVVILVFFDVCGKLGINFGELQDPIDVGLLKGVLDDQVSVFVECGDLLSGQRTQG